MPQPNDGINFGHSSRLGYDNRAYNDKVRESTSPLQYIMDVNRIQNCNQCLSTYGPRSGYMGYGVSTSAGNTATPIQDLINIDSILSNRNVKLSKTSDGKVNPINVTDYTLNHARICDNTLNPIASHLTNPPQDYREMSINRFYDLPNNPQANIFYDQAINTTLEAKDNYRMQRPRLSNYDPTLPTPDNDKRTCTFRCINSCQKN